ncbi:tyrosine kinase receptor Cad96Ca-like [Uloborus diversus]|uniref:tyrosine kinase receptor Cad96Ca-like n=1 Tax=Uloborus diversus TaxID=327109 RepID=UPI002409AE30|nr:tyrosine kinase receptor Cad96Ca-like [Uloborus diversus]
MSSRIRCCLPLIVILCYFSLEAYAFTGHNTPPVFDFKREWLIQENEPVGSRIITVRTRDEDGDHIEYGIEPARYVDGSDYFRINKDTGEVYLDKTLSGQGGSDFYLYITANDGHQMAKIEVYIRVLESNRAAPPSEPPLDVPFPTSHPLRPFPPFVPSAPHPAHPSPSSSRPFRRPTQGHPKTPSPTAPSVSDAPSDQPPVREVPPREGAPGQGAGDVTSTLLPILAVTGVAPVLMLMLWFLHRRCKHTEKLVALKKASSGAARREGSLSETVAFSYSPAALLRPATPPFNAQSTQSSNPPRLGGEFDKWEFPRHRLQFVGIVGEGCFGQVWKCLAQDIGPLEETIPVAVKTLKENATEKEKKDLLSELEVMKLLEPHSNVVTLLGCCSDKDPILVIMEFVNRGKLQTYLRESRAERLYGNLYGSSKHLTSRDLTTFSYQIAKGMDYLASKGIIHRDLAARNVLVDENKVCKVADFGFARDVIASHVYERKSEGRLPIRWMAPESLFDNIYTTKTDVWSFGVLLWEIVTLGSTPYPGLSANEVIRRVRDGHRLEKPDHCRREMYNIMFYCWDKDPTQRPTFGELVNLLDRLLVSEHTYIELERFPDHSYYNITDLSGEKL